MLPVQMLYRGLLLNPHGVAVVDGDVRLTYADLVGRVDALASYLQTSHPQSQSRIGVCAHNNWQHVVAMLAVFASGHIWVPLNPRNSPAELADIARAANLQAIISDEEFLPLFAGLEARLVVAHGVGPASGSGQDTLAAICESHAGRRPSDIDHLRDGICAIKFTGGTTGKPKGVLQPCRAFMSCIASMLTVFGFNQTDRMLVVAPLTHGAGTFLLPVLASGGCNVLLDKAKAATVSDTMISEGITASFMPPTLIYSLMDHIGETGVKFPALRHLIYGAAPMPSVRIRQAMSVFGPRLAAIYGQTEAPTMIAAIPAQDLAEERNHESVGRPCPYNEVRIVDARGRMLPVGETGEVVVRGDIVMRGYLDRPDLTDETIVDGWLHTGDVGFLDERGYLFLKDRIRDVIISGGFNVYPGDVEAALAAHPEVREVVVFARPDDYWGQRVEAAVVLARGSDVTPDDLIGFARAQLGPVRTPKVIHLLQTMPTNPVGKVTRRDVLRTVDELQGSAV